MKKQSTYVTRWTKKKPISILLALIIGISAMSGQRISASATANTDEKDYMIGNEQDDGSEQSAEAYVYDTFTVEYKITSDWEGAHNAVVTLSNTGEDTIEGWELSFADIGVLSEIYNAVLRTGTDGYTVLGPESWNKDIPVGGSVSFGFCVSRDRTNTFPETFFLTADKAGEKKAEGEFLVEYKEESDWGSGFNASIKIANLSDAVIKDWHLEFDFARTITGIWDAEQVSHEGEHYLIKSPNWNQDIKPGASVSFGFSGVGGKSGEEPYEISLNGMTSGEEQPEPTPTPEPSPTPLPSPTPEPTKEEPPFTTTEEWKDLNDGTFPDMYSEDGGKTVYFIDGTYTADRVSTMEEAIASIEQIAPILNFHQETDSFVEDYEEITDTRRVFRMQQLYRGIPVYAREIIVEADASGKTLSLISTFEDGLDLSIQPTMTLEKSKEIACAPYSGMEATEAGLLIYEHSGEFRLAWQVTVLDPEAEFGYVVIVDAVSGMILDEIEQALYATDCTLTGTGIDGRLLSVDGIRYEGPIEVALHNGNTGAMHDRKRNVKIFDSNRSSKLPRTVIESDTTTIEDPVAITTMYNFAKTYDFYLNEFGWKSYNGKGADIKVYLNWHLFGYEDRVYRDAAYIKQGFNHFFIVGDVSAEQYVEGMDVIAHEYTHGVMGKKVGLDDSLISRTIGEAYGDIMGVMVETLSGNDPDAWKFGEHIFSLFSDSPHADSARNLQFPEYSGMPAPTEYKGENWLYEARYASEDKQSDFIHYNSTVVSNTAYKMSLVLGKENYKELAGLWYDSMKYLTKKNIDFSGVRRAVYRASIDRGYSEPKTLEIQNTFFQNKIDFLEKNSTSLTIDEYRQAVLNYYLKKRVKPLIFDGHTYAVFAINEVSGYAEAAEVCWNMGSHLVTISSQEENDAVYNYMRKQGYVSAYLGYSDREQEGSFIWITDEEVVYENWAPGEPNSSGGNEDYAMFYYKFTDGTWNDGDFLSGNTASDVNIFICEWEYEL